ncbi:MAG: alkaline phosphatase family protein [Nitrososphaeria archaeon]
MNNRIMIIGIDSLEYSFISKLIEQGYSRGFILFKESGSILPLKSTFPPDTLLAWPTIYTGLLANRFGLKPEPEDIHILKEESIKIRNKLKGKTFWDIASRKRKKVLIINPIFGYPPWEVRGIMVSGPCFGLKGKTLSCPHLEYLTKYELGTYGKSPLLPHEYKLVWNDAIDKLVTLFQLAYRIINEDLYDIVFFADYTLDRIQHYFWNFGKSNDILQFIYGNKFRDAIMNYYRLLDFLIYWLIRKFEDEYIFVVLGDHGHKERPHTLIALDDILNQHCNNLNLKEMIKHISYTFLHYSRLSNISYYFVKKMQEKGYIGKLIKKHKISNNTCKLFIETLTEFGLKEYVAIRVTAITNKYLKDKILNKLSEILTRSGLAEFAITPSQYYEILEQLDVNADLFIKLIDGIGNMQSMGSFKCIPNYTRSIISGGHAMYSSFMIYGANQRFKALAPIIRVQDVGPSMLGISGINVDELSFDGIKVIEECMMSH